MIAGKAANGGEEVPSNELELLLEDKGGLGVGGGLFVSTFGDVVLTLTLDAGSGGAGVKSERHADGVGVPLGDGNGLV